MSAPSGTDLSSYQMDVHRTYCSCTNQDWRTLRSPHCTPRGPAVHTGSSEDGATSSTNTPSIHRGWWSPLREQQVEFPFCFHPISLPATDPSMPCPFSTFGYPVCTDWTLWPKNSSWHHVFFEKMKSTLITFCMSKPQILYLETYKSGFCLGSFYSSIFFFRLFSDWSPYTLPSSFWCTCFVFFSFAASLNEMAAYLRGVSPRRR